MRSFASTAASILSEFDQYNMSSNNQRPQKQNNKEQNFHHKRTRKKRRGQDVPNNINIAQEKHQHGRRATCGRVTLLLPFSLRKQHNTIAHDHDEVVSRCAERRSVVSIREIQKGANAFAVRLP
uniref:Uncharacterized protein n=1 Tax=Craspedostauros australis TaxID=1486917 RepID=A0A7R9WV63_9STRA|mmetsp:Transcript_22609/g.63071  ORF Transcript_22609/g.63071 Transcript_22609/m.63071 type:complete len:124 (+) Transcript_22609:298-669(+)